MALGTYSELKTALAAHLGRSDLTTELADFIAQAEADLNQTLRCRQMEQRATATATQYMALPTDYLEMRRLHLQNAPNVPLKLMTPEEANIYSTSTGEPKGYVLLGNQLQLVPAPDGTYTVEIDYWQAIPALSDSNTTNWLLALAPQLYLAAAIFYACVQIQDDQRAQAARAAVQGHVSALQGAERKQRWSGSPLATRAA